MSRSRRGDAVLALAFAAGALALAATVVLAQRAFREAGRAAASSPPIEPPTPQLCTEVAKRYHEAWEARNRCATDADCVATPRGELFTGLDRCARVGPRAPDTAAADEAGAVWLAAGCASTYEICDHVPEAQCLDGVCAEVPPASFPRSWRRIGVGRGSYTAKGTLYGEDPSEPSFDVFVPPGLVHEPMGDPEGGISDMWRGEHFILLVSYDFWAPDAGRPADALSSEAMTLGGHAATLFVTPYRGRDQKLSWTAVQLVFARGGTWPGELAIRALCKSAPPCPEGELVLRSIVFRGR
jgi:hypothetical protein